MERLRGHPRSIAEKRRVSDSAPSCRRLLSYWEGSRIEQSKLAENASVSTEKFVKPVASRATSGVEKLWKAALRSVQAGASSPSI